jgi:hypothetical protein
MNKRGSQQRVVVLLLIAWLISFAPATTRSQSTQSYNWRNVTIKGGGFVSGIVFHPTAPDLMYARTDVGGAYRWNAAAHRWLPITDWIGRENSNYTGIESLALDPNDPARVYLAAGTYTQSWAGTGAFLRSTDQGNTWAVAPVSFKMGGNEDGRSNGERLVVDPNQSSRLFFGSRKDGLWQSVDYGASWNKVNSFPVTTTTNGVGLVFVQFVKGSGTAAAPTPIIYVGVSQTNNNLYRSTDAGATWQTVAGTPTGLMPHQAALDSTGNLYLTFNNGPGPNGVTAGSVWKLNLADGAWANVTPPTGQGGFSGVSVDAQHPGTLVVTTIDRWSPRDQLYRSSNSGNTWTAVFNNAAWDNSLATWSITRTPHWLGDVEIDPRNSGRVLFITGYGVWESDNLTDADIGGTTNWTFNNDGLEETVPLALISPPSGAPLLSVLGDIGGFRHEDFDSSPPPANYFNSNNGTNTCIDFAESNPNLIARVHWGNARGSYSLDGGKTWTDFRSAPPAAIPNGPGGIAVSADGSTFVWMPKGSAAFYSTDSGATWAKCRKGAPSPNDFQTMWPTADRVNASKFYLYDIQSGTVYMSANGGAKFKPKATGLPTGGGLLRAVPGLEGHLWLPGGNGLYHSTDSGANFARLASVQEAYQVGFGKTATGQNHPAIYLWGKINNVTGIYRSDDTGASWVHINDDRQQFGWINIIIGDPRTYGRVYIATGGRGILYGEP